MNDEASVHYTATIDQMAVGLQFLQRQFGSYATPRIAWQIDPFGHSSAHAALSAQMGLEGIFFARMHYQDYENRIKNKQLEFNWVVEGGNIFAGKLFRHYSAPPEFCFAARCHDPPIVTNKKSPEYNLDERMDTFVKLLQEQADAYKSGHIMITMGGDFNYQNAHKYFKNLDILMKHINANSSANGFKMMYSTPSRYMDAVLQNVDGLSNKTDDLFPYADSAHSYWTGYFTSRPTLKGYVRSMNNFLQACKHIEVMYPHEPEGVSSENLRLAMGVAQHHDAVSGTSKQHVADDYSQRLAIGQTECELLINSGLQYLTGSKQSLHSCRLAHNESYCPLTGDKSKDAFTFVVYNPRSIPRNIFVRIPINSPNYRLINPAEPEAFVSYVPTHHSTYIINPDALPMEAVVQIEVPGMGYSTFQLKKDFSMDYRKVLKSIPATKNENIRVESMYLVVYFDSDTGSLVKVTNKKSQETEFIKPKFMNYRSSKGNHDDKQPSGAYIFRPKNGTVAEDIGTPALENFLPGEFVTEIWQSFSDWTYFVYRIYANKPYIEVQWTVGPIPMDYGREVIVRYETDLDSGKTFYTDSNGREMLKRVIDYQPTWRLNLSEPIAGNYYPVNSRISIFDNDKHTQLTVLTDRSQGGTSLSSGEMELMVHRRMYKDDHRGVAEPLNETQFGHGLIARGKHWLYYSDISSYGNHRDIGLDLFYEPVISIGADDEFSKSQTSSFVTTIDTDLNIVTLEKFDKSSILVRVENIKSTFEGGELMLVDLEKLFGSFFTTNFQELGLAGDRPIPNVVSDMKEYTKYDNGNVISLKPLQIRTFLFRNEENTSDNLS